jgi:hypothetical protein
MYNWIRKRDRREPARQLLFVAEIKAVGGLAAARNASC